jgi:hypothetical protein
MDRHLSRIAAVAFGIACTAAFAAAQAPAPGTISAIDRFSGRLPMAQKAAPIAVQYQIWSLAPGTKDAALPLRAKGYVVYELRAGKLTTVIDGKPDARREGEFWLVRPDQTIAFEAEDDSVVVHTILLPAQ